MSKYSNELKLEIVKCYFEKNYSYLRCCNEFNIKSTTSIKRWVDKYRNHGVSGLLKQLKSSYDGKFKQNVVEYMHNNHLSATETASYFNLGNSDIVLKWERIYYEKGPQALYKMQRGRPPKMNSNKPKSKKELTREEKLIEENKRLRMENEYLKKLDALVQERIKRENKKK